MNKEFSFLLPDTQLPEIKEAEPESVEATGQNTLHLFVDQPNDTAQLPAEEYECDHHYEELLRGVRCLKCGHFVGNWE